VHYGVAVTWKILSYVFNNFIVVLVSTSKFFPSCSIFDFRLLSFDAAKSVAMSSIEVRLFTISCQTNGVRVQRMKPGKRFDDREPADYINRQQDIGKVLGMVEKTHACRLSDGDKSPRSGSVIIRPLTNSIT
jgi:hypothetical protein